MTNDNRENFSIINFELLIVTRDISTNSLSTLIDERARLIIIQTLNRDQK